MRSIHDFSAIDKTIYYITYLILLKWYMHFSGRVIKKLKQLSRFLQEYLGFHRHIKPIRINVWIIRRFGTFWRKTIVTSRYQLLRLFETQFCCSLEHFPNDFFAIFLQLRILNAYQSNSTLLSEWVSERGFTSNQR